MSRAGADLWVNDLSSERAESVCAEIGAEGGTARSVVADVCDADAVDGMLEATGPLDILVNNAGSGVRSFGGAGNRLVPFVETGPADWDPVIRVNLAGVLHVTRAYLPGMLDRRWGRVLVIVSDAGRRGERRQVVYGAAAGEGVGEHGAGDSLPGRGRDGAARVFTGGHDSCPRPRQVAVVRNHDVAAQSGFQLLDFSWTPMAFQAPLEQFRHRDERQRRPFPLKERLKWPCAGAVLEQVTRHVGVQQQGVAHGRWSSSRSRQPR